MKIGIITIHRSISNYGASAQCYAFWKFIKNMGIDCEVIDLLRPCFPTYKRSRYDSKLSFKSKMSNWIKSIIRIDNQCKLYSKGRQLAFESFNNLIDYSETFESVESLYSNPPLYDLYITGSDQVWNPEMSFVNEPYFLTFAPENAKRISYASSFAIDTIPIQYCVNYRRWLLTYQSISVREKTGRSIIKKLTGRDAEVVLDPIFLLSSADWNLILNKPTRSKDYILLYSLNYNSSFSDCAIRIAEQHGWDIILIQSTETTEEVNKKIYKVNNAGPLDWMGYIQNAKLVLTDSFHGTAFSILFGTPFYSFVKKNSTRNGRIISLLEILSLSNHIIDDVNIIVNDIGASFDHNYVNVILERERQKSIDFLIKSIQYDNHL